MIQYLMPCDCGAKTPVNRSQAGMTLPCSGCGKSLDVPTIRNMASLAVETAPSPKAKSGRPSIALGLLAAAALIVGIATLAYGSVLAWDHYQITSGLTRDNIDLSKSEDEFLAEMRKQRLNAPPADTWDFWNLLVDEGLSEPNPPDYFKIKRYLDNQKPWIQKLFATSGISLSVFALSAFLMQKLRRRTS
jgi:hypothetical protein